MLAFLRLMSLQGERCREPWGVGNDCGEAASPVGALAGVAAAGHTQLLLLLTWSS